ncbi:hypothetical protein [Desulfuribacillus alkaliarsenatis]|uniref:Dehalogenase n=1 Tax=Desulfuribacillus alkaliarsenatis TaxID=766136 RepID=A0A1E5G5P1_9FIRM|nr:hypothetical protein [Desulfuribacillus alkaliarsenatis]OEF98009.1 hypothetical protein BHF68_13175 [Desulfuribacillus alkaliarsenatis]
MGFFWYTILGVIFGAGALWLLNWAKEKEIKIRWYSITLFVLGLFTLLLTIEAYIGNLQEFESRAAGLTLVFMGIPALLLIGAAVGLTVKNMKSVPAVSTESTEVKA